MITDVSARLHSSDLFEALDRLRYLTQELGVWIWETDADLRVIYVDGSLPTADGLTLEQVTGKSLVELHENIEHLCEHESHLATLRAHEPFRDYEFVRYMPNGLPVYLSLTGMPMFAEDGQFRGYRGVARNVTREALARHDGVRIGAMEERRLLKEAIETIDDAFAVYDADDRLILFNGAYKQLYGDIVKAGVSFRAIYDDINRRGMIRDPGGHIDHWKQRRMARTPQKLPPIEQQLVDGRWLRVTSVRRSDGGSVELRSDITALKAREQELQKSEERFRTLFISAASGIAINDPDGRILAVNPAFCRIADRAESELLATNIYALLHPDDRQPTFEQRRRMLAGEYEHFTIERRLVGPQGNVIWVRNSVSVVRDEAREPQQIIAICEDITERKRVEERLRESEALLQIAGRTAGLGGWAVDLPDHRLQWSDEVCRLHDLPPGSRYSLDEAFDFIAPEDRERLRVVFTACAEHGTPYDEEVQLITASGRRRWTRAIANAVRDETGRIMRIQGSFQDVTERHEALEETRRIAERLNDTLERITDAVFALDTDWCFTYLNSQAECLLQRSRTELLGSAIWDEFPSAVDSIFQHEYEKAIQTQQSVNFEAYYPPLASWFDVKAYPSGGGLTVYFRDVTKDREIEAQLAHTARLTSMGEMAASLAHEINQPLSVINMAAEGASMELDEEAPDLVYVGQRLSAVLEQIAKLRDLVNHIRNFSRQDDNVAEPFDLAAAIGTAIRLVQHDYENDSIKLHVEVPDQCLPVRGFPMRLEQVIVNLLSNARDAILDRATRETNAPREVRLSVASELDSLKMRISDTGGGIPPEAREKVFEPFFTTKKPGKGTGLGLSIVHSIIISMKGCIAVNNIEGGCAFTITLPSVGRGCHASVLSADQC